MSQLALLGQLISDAALAAFTSAVVFVATYSVLAPWWRSPIGRAMVTLDTAIAVTLAPSILHRFFGVAIASIGFMWLLFACLCVVAGATLWRTWILAREQIRGRRQ